MLAVIVLFEQFSKQCFMSYQGIESGERTKMFMLHNSLLPHIAFYALFYVRAGLLSAAVCLRRCSRVLGSNIHHFKTISNLFSRNGKRKQQR